MNEFAPRFALDQSMKTKQVLQQRPEIHTRVWNRNPQSWWKIKEVILPGIVENPKAAYSVVLAAESGGGGKGTNISQGNAELEGDVEFEGILEALGKEYQPHYASTASLVAFGINNRLQTSPYGNPTSDEIDLISRVGDKALRRAEIELPESQPNGLHFFWDEFAGVADSLNAGTTTVKRLGKDEHAVVIFMVSNPLIQALAYEERYELWQEKDDPEEVLRNHHSVLDMDAVSARRTMGTHKSIEINCAAVNEEMFEIFDAGRLELPEETPYELRRDFESEVASGRNVAEYFRNLTTFAGGKMTTDPIRPFLQDPHYHVKALDWGFLRGHYYVFQPEFVEDDIYGFPTKLKQVAFDWEHYSQPELEALRQGEEI